MKFFINLELRYSTRIVNFDGEEETKYNTVKSTSMLFDTKEEAIQFGNKLITNNNWIEQYPGYIGQRLTARDGLVMFRLKNGAEIFIKIGKTELSDLPALNDLLQTVKNLKK